MPFPKPQKQARERRRMARGKVPMNPIGDVGRARLELNKELTKQAVSEDWLHVCELKAVLVEHGLASPRCSGPLTFAHSKKHRGDNENLAREVARGCEGHHFYTLDLLPPRLAEMIVLEAIARRTMEPATQMPLMLDPVSCSTCLMRLTKTPSHDPMFDRHLKHATLADLRVALAQTIEMKTSRRLIEGRIRQLEREAQWRRE
jgi:hypothetical protein